MSELHELREIAADLVRNLPGPLSRVVVRCPPHEVELEWFAAQLVQGTQPLPAAVVAGPAMPATQTPLPESTGKDPDQADGNLVVLAPVVGTFYHAAQPGTEPFVAVGSLVEPGQTLGIVEAMKLMNHIAAEDHGRVVRICVEDGGRVEFEQPLVVIEPLAAEQAA